MQKALYLVFWLSSILSTTILENTTIRNRRLAAAANTGRTRVRSISGATAIALNVGGHARRRGRHGGLVDVVRPGAPAAHRHLRGRPLPERLCERAADLASRWRRALRKYCP